MISLLPCRRWWLSVKWWWCENTEGTLQSPPGTRSRCDSKLGSQMSCSGRWETLESITDLMHGYILGFRISQERGVMGEPGTLREATLSTCLSRTDSTTPVSCISSELSWGVSCSSSWKMGGQVWVSRPSCLRQAERVAQGSFLQTHEESRWNSRANPAAS